MLDKGPFRSRQVGARNFAAPQWSNLKPRAGFCAGNPEPHLGITLNNLEIYETNTSNQSQPTHPFSVNRLQLSADRGCKEHRRSTDREAVRFSQTKQRFSRHRSGPRLCRGIFSVHCDRLDLGLADSFQHCSRGSDGARLLTEADIPNQESRKPGNGGGVVEPLAASGFALPCRAERQSGSDRDISKHFWDRLNSLISQFSRRYRRGFTVHVARPTRSIPPLRSE